MTQNSQATKAAEQARAERIARLLAKRGTPEAEEYARWAQEPRPPAPTTSGWQVTVWTL